MSYARQMLDTYPRAPSVDADLLAATIDALSDCAQACTADTDADLSEDNLAAMVRCIRLCLDCTDVCTATAGVISRLAEYDASATRPLLRPARRSAGAAVTNASAMPTCRTAGSAPRPAVAANEPAGSCWTL
jgi:ferredoxin